METISEEEEIEGIFFFANAELAVSVSIFLLFHSPLIMGDDRVVIVNAGSVRDKKHKVIVLFLFVILTRLLVIT